MTLYTSYLAFFKRKDKDYVPWLSPEGLRYLHKNVICSGRLVDVVFEPVFVMRSRGNLPVEPPKMVLDLFKEGAITWEGYRDAYLHSLQTETSFVWMQNLTKKAQDHPVVLVCFEKDSSHCHRRLLAETIARNYGIEYKGELQ